MTERRKGINAYRKGAKFENRIKREIAYYGGLVTRCAASKPVDLQWTYRGVHVVIECKDEDRLDPRVEMAKLQGFADVACCLGLFVWQDRYYNVNLYLTSPNSPPDVWASFDTFKDIVNFIDSIAKPIANRLVRVELQ